MCINDIKNIITASFLTQSCVLAFMNCWSSLVSISFENYRMVHPFEDSDSSDDEVDWQDTRHDPYRLGECYPKPNPCTPVSCTDLFSCIICIVVVL